MSWRTITVLLGLCCLTTPGVIVGLECPEWAIDQAEGMAGGVVFDSTSCTEISAPSLHLNLLLLRGVYRDEDSTERAIEVGLHGESHVPITMAHLVPRHDTLSTEVRIEAEDAYSRVMAFFASAAGENFPPDGFSPDSTKEEYLQLDSLGPEKIWRTSLVQREDGVTVLPGICLVEVDAQYNGIATYAFHREDVSTISPHPSIDADSARALARIFLADSTGHDPSTMLDGGAELLIGYGNGIFAGQGWMWRDDLCLFWGCTFHDCQFGQEVLQVWVNAHPPYNIGGGLIYEGPEGELFCMANQGAECNVWQEALGEMGYDVQIHGPSSTVSEVQGGISSGHVFVMQTHGRLGGCGGTCPSALLTDFLSPVWFCPEHLIDNDLRWGLLSCCYSGDFCFGYDFKNAFIDHGTALFQGYSGLADPDLYERYQAYFVEQGECFANAHQLSKVLNPPHWDRVVLQWADGAYGRVRLAPVFAWLDVVGISGDLSHNEPFQVRACVVNRDDLLQQPAENVEIRLDYPPGFAMLSGTPSTSLGDVAYSEMAVVQWTLKVNEGTPEGTYFLDLLVDADNLGAAVPEPSFPYRRYALDVGPPPQFVRGDVTADGTSNIFDGVRIIAWLGGVAQEPPCLDAADVHDDGDIDLFDAVKIFNWLGGGSEPPPEPCCGIPEDCGTDQVPDGLGCDTYPPCGWNPMPVVKTASVGRADENSLAAGETEGSGCALSVPIILTNVQPLLGFSFSIEYDHELLSATFVDNSGLPTEGFDLFIGGVREPGLVSVVGVSDMDMGDGIQRIPAGTHRVAEIVFRLDEKATRRDAPLKFRTSEMAIDHHRALSHRTVDGLIGAKTGLPTSFSLLQNHPNPFNPTTEIEYALKEDCQVNLAVYNLLGQRVRSLVDGRQTAGHKAVRWDGRDDRGQEVASGVYLLRISAGSFRAVKRMALLR